MVAACTAFDLTFLNVLYLKITLGAMSADNVPSKSSLRKSGLGMSGTEQSDPEYPGSHTQWVPPTQAP